MMKKLFTTVITLCLINNLSAQETYTAFQSRYDLGLVCYDDPFVANRNSALLLKMRQYQIGLNFKLTKPTGSIISIMLPLQYNLALAGTWNRKLEERLIRAPTRATEYSEHDNQFIFSIAHPFLKNLSIGHQISTRTLTKSDLLIWDRNVISADSLLDKDSYLWEGAYQIGLYWDFSHDLRLGLLMPRLIAASFLETRIARFETRVDKKVTFWGQQSWQANLPEIAVEFLPTDDYSFVTALGKENDRPFFHGAVKSIFFDRVTLAAGFDFKQHGENQFLLGAGSYFGGFHFFYSFNFNQKLNQLLLSFSPQQEKQLIQLSNFEQKLVDIFLYKLDYYYNNTFIVGTIKNLTQEKVSLHLELTGTAIQKITQSFMLSSFVEQEIYFHFPQIKKKLSKSTSDCQLLIIAFQKGKQIIEKSFPIKILEIHQWNGELDDLIYFIQTENQTIFNLARKISQNLLPNSNTIQYTEAVFTHLSQNLRYLKDPTLQTTDYVQFPCETLSQKSGDCEDLCLLYCSLLGALGIPTALVEINLPEKSEDAHIFVLVNTGLKPEHFHFLQTNPNRYVFREQVEGDFKAWLPVELTLVGESFEKAWEKAAEEYYQYAILKGGLAQGWVKIGEVF